MEFKRSNLLTLFVLTLPLLVLIPSMGDFPFRSVDVPYTDFAITHFPNAVFLVSSLKDYHQIPWWSPSILSGYPFFANPLSGLLYPPGWLALFFPLPLGFNIVLALHLIWGGYGMFRLMKNEGLSHWAALFSGLGFALLPKIFAHYGAGHLTLIYAISWTPWLLLSQVKRLALNYRQWEIDVPAGILLGLVFLADVRWSAYAGILWIGYAFANQQKDKLWKTFLHLVGQVALACLVAAPLALPLLEYTLQSSRRHMGVEQIGVFSLPPANLVGLFFPNFHGNQEWVIYAGSVCLVLALLAITTWPSQVRIRYWGMVVFLSLMFALGDALPGFAWLARMPGLDLLRVPSRAIFLGGMALVALAGFGVEAFSAQHEARIRKRINLVLIAVLALTLALGIGLVTQAGGQLLNIAWGMVFTLVGVIWIIVGLQKHISYKTWLVGVFCLAILDWGGVARLSFESRSAQDVTDEQSSVADYLASQEGYFRIYSPSYSVPQQTAALNNLQLADGVDPLQLEVYAAYMEHASGVPRRGYQVTIPTYASGDPAKDNLTYLPDPEAMGKLNVAYIVSEFDIFLEEFDLVELVGDTRIYRNLAYRPRAWVQSAEQPLGEEISAVTIDNWSPNRIDLTAQGPGWLVLSEITYPGWVVSIDGVKQSVVSLNGLFRGVELKVGFHQVVFKFIPWSLYLGFLILLLGFAVWALFLGRIKSGEEYPKGESEG